MSAVPFRGIALLFLCLAAPIFAQTAPPAEPADDDSINADRPGVADSSNIIPPHRLQIEAGFERDHLASRPDTRVLTTPLLLRLGITKDFELRAEGNGYEQVSVAAPPSDSVKTNGWNSASIGFKYRFCEQDRATHRPQTSTIVRVFIPSGSGAFKTQKTSGDVRLVADLDLSDRFSLNPNLGIAFNREEPKFTSVTAALTLGFEASKSVDLFVDCFTASPEGKGAGTGVGFDAGGAYLVGRNTAVDLSFGWRARGEATANFFVAAGFAQRF
jgi:hypothetical protein